MPGAPHVFEIPTCPIPGQEGEAGFKARLAAYIRSLPPGVEVQTVHQWIPGIEKYSVDWREQARRIAAGEPYELVITIRDTRRG